MPPLYWILKTPLLRAEERVVAGACSAIYLSMQKHPGGIAQSHAFFISSEYCYNHTNNGQKGGSYFKLFLSSSKQAPSVP